MKPLGNGPELNWRSDHLVAAETFDVRIAVAQLAKDGFGVFSKTRIGSERAVLSESRNGFTASSISAASTRGSPRRSAWTDRELSRNHARQPQRGATSGRVPVRAGVFSGPGPMIQAHVLADQVRTLYRQSFVVLVANCVNTAIVSSLAWIPATTGCCWAGWG